VSFAGSVCPRKFVGLLTRDSFPASMIRHWYERYRRRIRNQLTNFGDAKLSFELECGQGPESPPEEVAHAESSLVVAKVSGRGLRPHFRSPGLTGWTAGYKSGLGDCKRLLLRHPSLWIDGHGVDHPIS
jgi:hypothetical protein